jgi:DinB superfamily
MTSPQDRRGRAKSGSRTGSRTASRAAAKPRAKTEDPLRAHLQRVLDWEDAHAGFGSAIDGIGVKHRGMVPEGAAHSPWQLLEHLRLAQRDILDFCIDRDYSEPASMDAYWPPTAAPPNEAAWDESVAAFQNDLARLKRLAADEKADLFDRVPHGNGQTYLRELLLVADHNAYHVGQLILVRRLLGIWPR